MKFRRLGIAALDDLLGNSVLGTKDLKLNPPKGPGSPGIVLTEAAEGEESEDDTVATKTSALKRLKAPAIKLEERDSEDEEDDASSDPEYICMQPSPKKATPASSGRKNVRGRRGSKIPDDPIAQLAASLTGSKFFVYEF